MKEVLISILASLSTALLLWLIGFIGQIPNKISIPSGAIVAFDSNQCPNDEWIEYKLAYGRFLRGIDHSGNNIDPDGERKVGSIQEDGVGVHNHKLIDSGHKHNMSNFSKVKNIYDSGSERSAWGYYSTPIIKTSSSKTGIKILKYGIKETRPKNIALLFCIKK